MNTRKSHERDPHRGHPKDGRRKGDIEFGRTLDERRTPGDSSATGSKFPSIR